MNQHTVSQRAIVAGATIRLLYLMGYGAANP
jgi:hypothetical protein